MSEGPWIRFFPSDWLAGTRGMTAAETGIYITLIAMMYERGEPIPNDTGRLARLCGTTTAALKSTLSVLCNEGKISITDGGLWNDRVGVETEIRRDKSTSAQKSAETRWRKNKQKQHTTDASALPSQSGRNANQKPDTRGKNSDASHPQQAREPSEFDQWYQHYPHKVQRGAAERAFSKARKLVSLEELIAGLHRYVRSKPEDRHWQNPATWLNGKGWLDEPASPPPRQATSPPPKPATQGSIWTSEAISTGLLGDESTSETAGCLGPGHATGHHRGPNAPWDVTLPTDRTGH